MKKGENIFKRKDGRWEARYIKGYELSGKIKYGFCYGKTYKEAKEKVTKCKAALISGKPLPSANSRHRFAFYCDEWLRLRKTKIRESTYIKYDTILEKHIKPKLGGCDPMGITTGVVDDFTRELLFADKLSVKYVDSEGYLTDMPTRYEDGYAVFETDHFSDFLIQPTYEAYTDVLLAGLGILCILVIALLAVILIYMRYTTRPSRY